MLEFYISDIRDRSHIVTRYHTCNSQVSFQLIIPQTRFVKSKYGFFWLSCSTPLRVVLLKHHICRERYQKQSPLLVRVLNDRARQAVSVGMVWRYRKYCINLYDRYMHTCILALSCVLRLHAFSPPFNQSRLGIDYYGYRR